MTKFRLLREREKEKETDKEILKDNPKDKEKELTWNSNQTKERNQTARSKTSLITESAKPEKQRKRELVIILRNYRIICQRTIFHFNY